MTFILFTGLLPVSAAAAEAGSYVLPAGITAIEEESFAGNTALTSLVIPKGVESIGPRAFADCTNLREVYLGNNPFLRIAPDAFAGCHPDMHFYVYPWTSGELYALAHGFDFDLLEEGSTFFDRAMTLVANNGGASILQSGEFAAKRLITLRSGDRLPDVSAYQPTEIIRDGSLFVLQFDSVDNTANCYTFLANDAESVFVEADECVEALDDVSAAGVVDPIVWDTADPMGFDTYAPFVAANGTGSAVIAVIDSGVARNAHYNAKLRSDGVNMLKAQDGQEWDNDPNRHGSVIASVISDCVGNANVSILPIRVVNASGATDFILLGNAIKYAVSHGATIINLSLNFKQSSYVTFCLQQAMAAGVPVVVAAGNSGRSISNVYPANLSGVVAVSGLGPNLQLSATSNFGEGISYCAPDSYVKTSAYSNSLFNGTSFAAPMIASALALERLDPYHSIDDLNNRCYLSNDTDSPKNSYGYGMPQLAPLADVPVLSLAFDGALPARLAVGESLPLSFIFTPDNATNKQVTVVSDNESVLSVSASENGTVSMTANDAGTATLTAVSASTGVSVSREFTVVRPVSKITINGSKPRLSITKTLQLSAIVEPSNATTRAIEWKSTDESLATVSQSGLVTPKKTGKVGIYAQATDGYGAESDKQWIDIVEVPDAEAIELYVNDALVSADTEIPLTPGSTALITAKVLPEDAEQEVSFRALGSYAQVSPVDSVTGLVTAATPGVSHIYVASTDGHAFASVGIKVLIPPESVSVSGETTVDEGKSITLSATVLPEDADDRTVSWRSGNTSVATVDSTGKVTGVKAGTAIIFATANGDPAISGSATVTVRHPFTLTFEGNSPEEGTLTPALSASSLTAYSGYMLGTLPTATCDYYDFLGWYTSPEGGERWDMNTIHTTEEDSVTLYAQWRIHEESAWVLPSEVPEGARTTQTSYSYRESTESTSASMAGWISNGDYWRQTGSGSKQYASFPGTYNFNHWTASLNGSAYSAYENASSKRTVSNTFAGYVYWHWAYNAAYANRTDRWISDRNQTAGSSRGLTNYSYKYFYAFTSTVDAPRLTGFTFTWGAGAKYDANAVTYNCSGCLPSGADKSATSGLNNPRFLRFNYYNSTYTDYQKIYKYYREINYAAANPGSGSSISNLTTYVKYRAK